MKSAEENAKNEIFNFEKTYNVSLNSPLQIINKIETMHNRISEQNEFISEIEKRLEDFGKEINRLSNTLKSKKII